jgi:hypothetical protein
MERSPRDLIEILFRHLPGRTEKNLCQNRRFQADVGTEHLPNEVMTAIGYVNLFGPFIIKSLGCTAPLKI